MRLETIQVPEEGDLILVKAEDEDIELTLKAIITDVIDRSSYDLKVKGTNEYACRFSVSKNNLEWNGEYWIPGNYISLERYCKLIGTYEEPQRASTGGRRQRQVTDFFETSLSVPPNPLRV